MTGSEKVTDFISYLLAAQMIFPVSPVKIEKCMSNSICNFHMPILEKGGGLISHNYFF